MDECGVCGGSNTTCRLISGVFKHSWTKVGYHKIVEIPEGATKINVTEMVKSRNYLGGQNKPKTTEFRGVCGHVSSFTRENPVKAEVLPLSSSFGVIASHHQ